MREYSEKRDFHRMQVNTDIEIIDSNGNTFAGVCRDLSASGMQILVAQKMAVGSELRTTLHPYQRQVSAIGNPVRGAALRARG
ncbi:MAG: PilZ domain-containing protein [Marinobacter sp.]|nr:PilZ domain-containing protein [Marinobacter sp.]MCL1481550.1 PilZ domain-containing protein [Marinobacter sp.]